MGNVSPRQSKSYRDGLNHLSSSTMTASTTTPTRSSWKKQLQIINDTLNLKKFTLRHAHGRHKRYRTNFDETNHSKLATSVTTQNFPDLTKTDAEKLLRNERTENKFPPDNHFTKSFSLFSMKQPMTDITNKEIMTKSITTNIKGKDEILQEQQLTLNSSSKNYKEQGKISLKENQTTDVSVQYKRRHKCETTTGEYSSDKFQKSFVNLYFHSSVSGDFVRRGKSTYVMLIKKFPMSDLKFKSLFDLMR